MSQRFGPVALRLCGLAAQVLGWSPARFWAATPAELVAVLSPAIAPATGFDRAELNRMMEREA